MVDPERIRGGDRSDIGMHDANIAMPSGWQMPTGQRTGHNS
jgi:hypothetical protein